jgi:uncharacterized membrane-anchored protein YitT (DUF2179 family)
MDTVTVRTSADEASASDAPPHSMVDDVTGLLTGVLLASFGLTLLHMAGLVTGGTAGLALLLSHVVPWPFSLVFLSVTLPFVALGIATKGWRFTLRTALAIVLVAGLTRLHTQVLSSAGDLPPLYAAVTGNVAIGVGMLILFRHDASLGGFNIIALLAQERRGMRAGYVQLVLDATVVVLSSLVTAASTVAVSALGAVVVNVVLALNHRPGRYLGH